MFLQFFTPRTFIVPSTDIIKIVRGAVKEAATGSVKISNKGIVEMQNAAAKKFLKQYPKECETWGVDAVNESKKVQKGKTSTPKSERRPEIA